MGLVGSANLDAANTAFETAISDAFADKIPGSYQQFTTTIPASGTSVDLLVVDGEPQVREWVGSKHHKQLQAFKRNYPLRQWEKSLAIPMREIRGDNSGVIGQRIRDFVNSESSFYDYIVYTELLTNPTGYDGVSLLNDTHPNAGGGTSDNLTTTALSHAMLNTAQDALRQMKNMDGEPLNHRVTTLLVGSQLERLGMEITGSDRPVVFDGVGAQDGNTSVASAVLLQNYIGGPVNLIVSNRITGGEYFFFDDSKGRRKPMFLAEFRRPEGVVLGDPSDRNIYDLDEWQASITSDTAPMPGDWHTIYGSVTA